MELFILGSGSCPECGSAIRRSDFRRQLFEDATIDKEVDIRKRILKDFNMKEEDFATLREWNDYQEMVEDIIFNLANDLEILETNKRIAEYKEKNRDFISKHRHRVSREMIELTDILAEEARLGNSRKFELGAEEEKAKRAKLADREKLIDDLMFSEADAADIVNQHAKVREAAAALEAENAAKSRPVFSTGLAVNSGVTDKRKVEVKIEEAVPYVYEPLDIDNLGPRPPTEVEVTKDGYDRHVRKVGTRELAGGYHQSIACNRALQEAFAGLFFTPSQTASP